MPRENEKMRTRETTGDMAGAPSYRSALTAAPPCADDFQM